MSKQWTDPQRNAIYANDGSVLVSAAAGSGKTAVLVERVIQLITREDNPIDVDRLLIVTFTRAAAAEMRERISDAICALLDNDPYNPYLLKQKQLLYNANISTIDSFCSDLVREYFHTLNISGDFRIADEGELDILRKDSLDIVFEKFYKSSTPDFFALSDAFAGKNGDDKLRDTVLKISEFLSTQPFPDKWLNEMLVNYEQKPIANSVWGKIIIKTAHTAILHAINLTEISLKKISEDENLKKSMTPKFEDDLAFLTELQKKLFGSSWNEIRHYLLSHKPVVLSSPKGYKDHPIKLSVAANRDEVKSVINTLKSYFLWSEENATLEISERYALVSTLFNIVREYNKAFLMLKNKKNILSFSDIEMLTVNLLAVPDDTQGYIKTSQAYEISSRYDAVMVDEFQDVNDVQDLIFKCVSKEEANLFVVGDVKQSIYGFRQAKPEIFLSRKNLYNRFNEQMPVYPATIILDKNFRSRKQVCDAVNFIFKNLMTKETSKMDYNNDELLVAGAEYPSSEDCEFEIALIERELFENIDSAELEACYIADRIHSMINSDFRINDKGIMRKATYGDFAVIMRSPRLKAMQYVNTLIRCGIPAYSETKDSFFDASEIKIMLNLLRVIDNPAIDIPLLSVMCSPIYGFTPDELARIRKAQRHSTLYSAVKQYSLKDKKSADFLSELNSMRELSYTCSVDELISRVYEKTSFVSISLAVSGDNTVAKNLNLLREYARSFEKNGYKTLSDFIAYVDKLIANGTNLSASALNDASNINSVRVLSIHSSKGLEYPVCFIADTAHRFNKTDSKSDILIDSRAGLGIRRKTGFVKYDTLPRLAVSIEMSENELAEELRVLYVALTRAKEKLIIVSSQKDCKKYLNNLYSKIVFDKIIEPYSVLSCNSISDWICLCALIHPSLNKLKNDIIPNSKMLTFNKSDGKWIFNIVRNIEFLSSDNSNADENYQNMISDDFIDCGINYADILKENLSFEYINEDILSIPQKVSASDIAHSRNKDYFEKILLKPSFLNDEAASSVKRGTAHHKFLQYCNFERAKQSIDDEISSQLSMGMLTEEQAALLDKSKIKRFINSELVRRITSSSYVIREEQFTAKLKPSIVFDEYKNIITDECVIIQGAVDLAFEENGELVIVDYKTDRVGDIEKLKTLYSKQLNLYKEAMEQSTELKIKECILYSVHLNDYVII